MKKQLSILLRYYSKNKKNKKNLEFHLPFAEKVVYMCR